jgi:hypothetical protein
MGCLRTYCRLIVNLTPVFKIKKEDGTLVAGDAYILVFIESGANLVSLTLIKMAIRQ